MDEAYTDDLHIEPKFEEVQFVCNKNGEVVSCFYGKVHLSMSEIYNNVKLHKIYHNFMAMKNGY